MPSPFLGMDPYLEGYMWVDVHHPLATQLTLDYDQPPPEPSLAEADAAWAAERIQQWRDQ